MVWQNQRLISERHVQCGKDLEDEWDVGVERGTGIKRSPVGMGVEAGECGTFLMPICFSIS